MKNLKFKKFWAIGAAMLVLAPLASCSNEEAVEDPDPIVQDENTLTIIIPQMVAAPAESRVEASVSNDEAKISELYVVAYDYNGGDESTPVIFQDIKASKDASQNGGVASPDYTGFTDYAKYKLTGVKAGDYLIYVVANMTTYSSLSKETTKQQMADLILNFRDVASAKCIAGNNIPMVCMPKEIKKNSTEFNDATNGKFTFSEDNNTLYADLTMLCAKVRYTVLFDKTDDPNNKFYYIKDVDFTNVVLSNVKNQTYLSADKTETVTTESGTISLGQPQRYKKDSTNWNSYWNLTNGASTVPDNFGATYETGSFDDNEDTGDKQRAWQGIVYIPENKETSSENQTTFTFTPTIGSDINASNCKFTRDFQRGNFYDVVAKLQSTSGLFFDVAVYVKVKPWTYTTSGVTTW